MDLFSYLYKNFFPKHLYLDEENEESVFLDEDGWDYFSKNLLLNDDDESNESNE